MLLLGIALPDSPDRMSKAPRIALLIDTATTWGAGLIEGITEYAQTAGNWSFFLEPRGKYDRMLLPTGWRADGVIARITHQDLATQLIETRIPAVNVSWYRFGENLIPRCTCDETSAAQLAAKYFLDKGFRQFAYCGSSLRPNYSDRFGAAFVECLRQAGHTCTCFAPSYDQYSKLGWDQQISHLTQWLVALPKPVALLAFDDLQGRQITEACAEADLLVPHDIAVLGGEHDELCSRISRPPLSSVDQSPQEVGYQAAQMLARLLRGESLPETKVLIPPRRIISRQSTDKSELADDLLAEAMRFINGHYGEDLSVNDILRQVPLSRRALEKGFRKHLGRSPAEEIRRVRVEKALTLLCDTSWSVTKIAGACGFDRPELMTRAFRRELQATPSQFRKRHRAHVAESSGGVP